MKLWKITQDVNRGYDTFGYAVVAASDEEEAKRIAPGDNTQWFEEYNAFGTVCNYSGVEKFYKDTTWANNPDDVEVEYIGEAKPETDAGVVLASFDAG